jgi:hypothetical protein
MSAAGWSCLRDAREVRPSPSRAGGAGTSKAPAPTLLSAPVIQRCLAGGAYPGFQRQMASTATGGGVGRCRALPCLYADGSQARTSDLSEIGLKQVRSLRPVSIGAAVQTRQALSICDRRRPATVRGNRKFDHSVYQVGSRHLPFHLASYRGQS